MHTDMHFTLSTNCKGQMLHGCHMSSHLFIFVLCSCYVLTIFRTLTLYDDDNCVRVWTKKRYWPWTIWFDSFKFPVLEDASFARHKRGHDVKIFKAIYPRAKFVNRHIHTCIEIHTYVCTDLHIHIYIHFKLMRMGICWQLTFVREGAWSRGVKSPPLPSSPRAIKRDDAKKEKRKSNNEKKHNKW
mgnify:CR=1 FL=1